MPDYDLLGDLSKEATQQLALTQLAQVVAKLSDSLPLPTGAATELSLAAAKLSLDNIENRLPDLLRKENGHGSAVGTPSYVSVASTQADGSVSGILTNAGDAVTLLLPPGTSSTGVLLLVGSGTPVGSVLFETSKNSGADYKERVYRGSGVLNRLSVTADSFPSEWRGNSAGMSHLRVRALSLSGGTIAVALRSSTGVGAMFLNAAIPIGGVSSGNAFASTLAVAASYSGAFEQMTNVAAINVFVASTQTGNLRVQYSNDGLIVAQEVVYPLSGTAPLNRIIAPRTEYVRFVVENTGPATATALLEVVYRAVAVQIPLINLSDDAPTTALAAITKTTIQGINTWSPSLKTVTATAQRVDGNVAGRKSISVRARNYNSNADAIYIGSSSAVSSSLGIELKERESISIDLAFGAQVWAIGTRAGGNPLEVIETWDV